MKTIAYLRISTGSQDLANQKLAVLDYARQNRFAIDRFVEAQASSRKGRDQRRIDELLGELAVGDRLVVSELSRLGRSLSQVIQIVDDLVKRKVRFIAIKEAIRFEGKQDLQTKVMVALFGLFAEVERDLISERTKEGLAAPVPRAACSAARKVHWARPSSTARRGRSGCSWRRRSPRRRSPRSWAYRRPTSVTSRPDGLAGLPGRPLRRGGRSRCLPGNLYPLGPQPTPSGSATRSAPGCIGSPSGSRPARGPPPPGGVSRVAGRLGRPDGPAEAPDDLRPILHEEIEALPQRFQSLSSFATWKVGPTTRRR